MKLIKNSFLFLFLAAFVCSCLSDQVLEATTLSAQSESAISAYLSTNNIAATKLSNGNYYFLRDTVSTSRVPQVRDSIMISYTIKDLKGNLLEKNAADTLYYYGDASTQFNGTPYPIFQQVVSHMKEGQTGTLIVQGTNQTIGKLPANTPVRIDINSYKIRNQEDWFDDYIKNNNLTLTKRYPSGLRYCRTKAGTGKDTLATADVAWLKYAGYFLTNVAFDNNFNKVDTFKVTIGSEDAVIRVAGFKEAIHKLKVGERGIFLIPWQYAYGSKSNGTIPAYSPLIFDIYLFGSALTPQ